MKTFVTLACLSFVTLPIAGCNGTGWARPSAEAPVTALQMVKGSGYARVTDRVYLAE